MGTVVKLTDGVAKMARCRDRLCDLLADGQLPASEVAMALEEDGFAPRTIRRAREDLVETVREGSVWMWRLQSEPAAEPVSARSQVERGLLALVPCSAREFSDGGHALGVKGRELGAMKIRLGIETYCEEPGGRWFCRLRTPESAKGVKPKEA